MLGARPGTRSIFALGSSGRHRRVALIGHVVARPAMTPAAAMQREAVRRTIVAILAGLIVLPIRTVRPMLRLLILLRLLMVVLRLLMVWLLVLLRRLLLALIVWLLLWRERLAAHGRLVIVAVVKRVVGVIAALLRLLLIEGRLGLPQVFLRGGDQAEIMLGVLVVVFGRDRIA